MPTLFDKQIQLRMGQANVRRWLEHLLCLLGDDDPLGLDSSATQHLPLPEARGPTSCSGRSRTGAVKILLQP
jgi:hypothetical protein